MRWIYKFSWMLCCIWLTTIWCANAQQENVWAFGINAGVDFNSGAPVAITTSIASNEACASVCNANGQLLFYTNGERVWDRFNNFMQNGFSICSMNVSSTTQGAIIVPMPDSSSKYYIFSCTALENGAQWGRLYYSVVDMTLNNGLGAVMAGRSQILVDSGLQENMTAVAGRSCNIWLLTITQQGVLKAFNIDQNGINYTPVQSPLIPGSGTLAQPKPGGMIVSPNRTKLAVADLALTLYDFNAATGTASNPLNLSSTASPIYYSACFSPDNSKLYATILAAPLEQYDLSSGIPANIINSRTILDPGTSLLATLKLGPDGKIYTAKPGAFLGVIQQPNQAGVACNYIAQSIPLAGATGAYIGLPNVVPHILPTGDTIFSKQTIAVSECFTNTFQLHADTLGQNIVWDDGSNLAHRFINGSGTYWVQYSKHCVMYSDTFVVSFPNASPAVLTYAGCKGNRNAMAVAITPNIGYAYIWRDNASVILSTSDTLINIAGGHYTLHVTTPAGCEATIDVIVPEEQHMASFNVDSIACQGNVLTFNNTSDSHFTQFHWRFGDGDSSLLQSPLHAYNYKGEYLTTLIAKGAICIDTIYKSIIVDSIMGGRFSHQPDSICMGESITFNPDMDSSIITLQWYFGDEINMNIIPENEIKHAYDKAGTMAIQLQTQYRACATKSFMDTIYVYPLPKVDLGPDTGLCLDGRAITLQNLQPEPDVPSTSRWNTGDTTTSIKIVHPGIYSLTVANSPLGCSTTEHIIIHKDCYIDIPNAFTPNGDGVNDYFFPRQLLSRNVSKFSMQILNRWGQLIFETDKIDGRGWDGNMNNVSQPQGVYLYLIDVTINNERQEKYNGNVTLIR